MAEYRKLPVVINAWTVSELNDAAEHNWSALPDQIVKAYDKGGLVFGVLFEDGTMGMLIPTLEGSMQASATDFIICGVKDEVYPCKKDIFESTYERVQ